MAFRDLSAPTATASQGFRPLTPSAAPVQQSAPQPDTSILGTASQTLENVPGSAVRFAGSAIEGLNPIQIVKNLGSYFTGFDQYAKDVGNPSDAALNVVKEVPHTLYESFVPQFVRSLLHGDTEGAQKAIVDDPVGQIAPLLMYGRAVAERAGVGPHFDAAVSKVASPVTKAASKVGSAATDIAAQAAGLSTGVGASSIKSAFSGSDAFTEAMRGKINPDEVVRTAHDAVSTIANNRRTSYLADLEKIGNNKSSFDISPVHTELQTQLKNFGIKEKNDGLDFSRSSIANNGSARADIQGVYDTVKDWGRKPGDRTAVGLDTLKKQLVDFYSESGSARAFVQAVKGKVSSTLNTSVPGYREMTGKYQAASQLLDDIKSATGVGSKAKADTVFTKMTTAMKADKELRLEIMKTLQAQGDEPHLMDKIAGINMQSWIPRGLVGKGADIAAAYSFLFHSFNPQFIPALLSTSPRVVGEFVRAMGLGTEKTAKVLNAINTVHPSTLQKFIPAAAVQENAQ
jgi:hypothetical protein